MTIMGGEGADSGGEAAGTEVMPLPRCFFDVEIGGVNAGRVIFELFTNLCPKTCENFRQLCTGEGGVGKTTGKPLHYKGTVFHRCIKDFMIQGGDFSNFNGTGGESIYGGTFEDENLQSKHDEPYMLSMANRGPNTNGSQFFILTQPAPHLNGIHVVFGRVVTGQGIIKQIEGLPVDRKTRPLSDVRISNCGELVLLKKKKEKKPKKEKKKKEKRVSDDEEAEKSLGELSDSGSDSGTRRKKENSKSVDVDENKEVPHPLATLTNIDPDDIPKDPPNRFLMRAKELDKDKEKETEKDDKRKKRDRRSRSRSRSRSGSRSMNRGGGDRGRIRYGGNNQTDKSGRKIKGRGRICFPRFTTSRSRSKTPPHWKAEARKTITMKEFEDREKRKRDKDDELKRRQDERRKRHEAQYKGKEDTGEKTADGAAEECDAEGSIEESTKIVEELTSQIQAAGDGVVYYQHLYRKNKEPEVQASSPEKVLEVFAVEDINEAPVDANKAGGEDLLTELRMRRELLKRRLKEWEESSGDEDDKEKRKKSISETTKSHIEDEIEKVNIKTKVETGSPAKEERRSRRRHSSEKESRHSRSRKSRTKSKSKSRSKSKDRSRREKNRRDSSRDKNRRGDRDRDRDRKKSDRRRSRSKSNSRSRSYRRR